MSVRNKRTIGGAIKREHGIGNFDNANWHDSNSIIITAENFVDFTDKDPIQEWLRKQWKKAYEEVLREMLFQVRAEHEREVLKILPELQKDNAGPMEEVSGREEAKEEGAES